MIPFPTPFFPFGEGLSLFPIDKHPLPQATGTQPGTMRTTCSPPHTPFLIKKNIQNTLCLQIRNMRSQPDAPPPPAIPVKKQYKVHVGPKYCVMLVSPASTSYCVLTGTAGVPAYCLLRAGPPSLSKNTTKYTSRLNVDHARPPRDHCPLVFDKNGLLCAGPPDTMMATPPRLRIGFRQ